MGITTRLVLLALLIAQVAAARQLLADPGVFTNFDPFAAADLVNNACSDGSCAKVIPSKDFCKLPECKLLNMPTLPKGMAQPTPTCQAGKYGITAADIANGLNTFMWRPCSSPKTGACPYCCKAVPISASTCCWPDAGIPCPAVACAASVSIASAGDCGCASASGVMQAYSYSSSNIVLNIKNVIQQELTAVCNDQFVPNPYCVGDPTYDNSLCTSGTPSNCATDGAGAVNTCFKPWLLLRATNSANAVARAVAVSLLQYTQTACTLGQQQCISQTTLDGRSCTGSKDAAFAINIINGTSTAVATAVADAFVGIMQDIKCFDEYTIAAASAYASAIAADIKTVTQSYMNTIYASGPNQFCNATIHTQLRDTTARAVACTFIQAFAAVYSWNPELATQAVGPPAVATPFAGACASSYATAGMFDNNAQGPGLDAPECKACCPPDCLQIKYFCGQPNTGTCSANFGASPTTTIVGPGNVDFNADGTANTGTSPFPGRPTTCSSSDNGQQWGAEIYGSFFADVAGQYSFQYNVDDGISLQLSLFNDCGDYQQINPSSITFPGSNVLTTTLAAGIYTFKIQYTKCAGGPAVLQFSWKKPGTNAFTVVPILCSIKGPIPPPENTVPPNNGSCVNITCAAPDQCRTAGTCNPMTGKCDYPAKPDGTSCDDGNACTGPDTCQAGVCIGSTTTCAAPDQCRTAGTCNPDTGKCDYPAKPDGTSCDDGNACTGPDTCQAGVCTGSTTTCTAPDQCRTAGTCNPITGKCDYPAKPDGTSCDDGNACTGPDTCQAGVCTGSTTTCAAPDQCRTAGTCNPMTGKCDYPAKPDGTSCDDGKPCTGPDTCQAGVCTGSTTTCAAPDQCHTAGTCNPDTGKCDYPSKTDGTECTAPSSTCPATCVDGTCTPSCSCSTGTAWAYSGKTSSTGACSSMTKSTCFEDHEPQSLGNNWGWTIFPVNAGDSVYTMLVGAGTCDPTKGANAGTVKVSCTNTNTGAAKLSVLYMLSNGYSADEYHWDAKCKTWSCNGGLTTNAPGQLMYSTSSTPSGGISVACSCANIEVAFHAAVSKCQ